MGGGKFTGMSCDDFGHGIVGNALKNVAAAGTAVAGALPGAAIATVGVLSENPVLVVGGIAVAGVGASRGADLVLGPPKDTPKDAFGADGSYAANKYNEPIEASTGKPLLSRTEGFIKDGLTNACKAAARFIP